MIKQISENELNELINLIKDNEFSLIKDKEISEVDWKLISTYQKLSKEFIKEFQDKIDWNNISAYQKLSEDFIKEFQDKVNWDNISIYQKLSEDFIKEFQDNINWDYISEFQKLSENFIKEFQDKVNWLYISKYQKLSEEFIREFQDKVNLYYISIYQKLSKEFIKEFNLKISETCWLYKSPEDIEKYIKEYTKYEIINGEVIAYKSCKSNGYSTFNFQYKYEVGKEYESHADCNINYENSFGLSAWTKEKAIEYCNEKLFKIGIKLEDIAAIVQNNNKIRARKIRIIEEII
jgi:phosphoribosylanthranilate isomerase